MEKNTGGRVLSCKHRLIQNRAEGEVLCDETRKRDGKGGGSKKQKYKRWCFKKSACDVQQGCL